MNAISVGQILDKELSLKNNLLTKGEDKVLKRLVAGEVLDEFIPGGWWIGDERISGKIGWSLLRKMALHEESSSHWEKQSHRLYTINSTGKKLLDGDIEGIKREIYK